MKNKLNKYINTNYKFDKLTMLGIIALIMVISGIFGWIYEVIFYYFNSGMKQFYFRGSNFLPFINIYTYGALLIWLLTYKRRKSPLKVFLISSISCGILEYLAGLAMFYLKDGLRCWSYNEEILNFGNIGGFVCLRSVLFFGLSGLLLIYVILPLVFSLSKKLPKKIFLIISFSLGSIFLIDEIYNFAVVELFKLPRASTIYKKLGLHYIYFNK